MKKERFEILIKRSLKKKVRITVEFLVCFMITGNMLYSYQIDDSITSDQNYDKNTILEKTDGTVINSNKGKNITINSGDNDLAIKHNITSKSGDIELGDSSQLRARATIFLDKQGSIDIKAKNFTIESSIVNSDKIISSYGIYLFKGVDKPAQRIDINAQNTVLTLKSNTDLYGISFGDNAQVNIFGNVKLQVESQEKAEGIRLSGGKINIQNQGTTILDSMGMDNSSNIATTTYSTEGTVNISSNDIKLTSTSVKDSFNIMNSSKNGKVVLSGNNITLISKSTEDIGSNIYGHDNTTTTKISGNGNIILEAESREGMATSIMSRSSLEIENSGRTTISAKSEKANATALDIYGGNVKIESRETVISTNSPQGGTVGIKVGVGNLTIDSEKTIISTKGTANIGISASSKANVEINGSLEIDTNREKGISSMALESSSDAHININKAEDKTVNVGINGDIIASFGGEINVNFNGNHSYFIGSSYLSEGEINLGISDGAVWENKRNSNVSNLKFNNGVIDMVTNKLHPDEICGQKISIDKISGNNGKIIMDISSAEIDTDYIELKNGIGQQRHFIEPGNSSIHNLVNYNFGDGVDKAILIGKTSNNITLEGNKFSDISNIYDYTLELKTNVKETSDTDKNWYVTGIKQQEGEVIENIETDLSLNYMNAAVSRSELDTIHKRLGEIRDYTSDNGIWFRMATGQMEHDKSYNKFTSDYNMLQLGYDTRKETEKGSVFTGIAVHKKDSKIDFRNGDGENKNLGLSLYKSFSNLNNSYTDIVIKYSHLNNDYTNYTHNNQRMKVDYSTWTGSLSLEHGKKYGKNNWYLTPHMQLNYTFIKGADYTMSSGVKVEQRDIESLIGKTGIYAGYEFKKSSHFVKASVLHEFMGDYGANITGADTAINKKYSGEDTWLELGVGGQIKVGDTNIYYDIERTFGSNFETNWQASLGIRYRF